MIHWEPSEDAVESPIWLRFIDCGPWGLVLTATLPRYHYYSYFRSHIVDA